VTVTAAAPRGMNEALTVMRRWRARASRRRPSDVSVTLTDSAPAALKALRPWAMRTFVPFGRAYQSSAREPARSARNDVVYACALSSAAILAPRPFGSSC